VALETVLWIRVVLEGGFRIQPALKVAMMLFVSKMLFWENWAGLFGKEGIFCEKQEMFVMEGVFRIQSALEVAMMLLAVELFVLKTLFWEKRAGLRKRGGFQPLA
jgi:hypothetical protein